MWTNKIDRAKQLKKEVEKALKTFLDSQPYKIDTKSDPQSKRLIYYITKADKVPTEIALITGDIIQNLRSSLDYLAYRLYTTGAGTGTGGRHIYFPIAENFDQYENNKGKKTKGLTQKAKDLIDAIKPYKDGNDILWKIHRLSIIDKHRLLVTVGSSFSSLDIGAHLQESMNRIFPELKVPAMPLFIKPADILFPLEVGDELFIDSPNTKPIPNMQFKFNIVLHEPGIVEGEILVETIQSMINEVETLISKFNTLVV